jgi:hypothetical protein
VDRRLGDRQAREGFVEKTTFSGPCWQSKRYSLVAHFMAEVFYRLNCPGPYNNNKKKKKLRGLSPQANYTDRATALVVEGVPTFAGRGCYVVSATDSHGR